MLDMTLNMMKIFQLIQLISTQYEAQHFTKKMLISSKSCSSVHKNIKNQGKQEDWNESLTYGLIKKKQNNQISLLINNYLQIFILNC
ncbi:unnamed protein product [Paramecium pentaurelia]|uniref:Uncharacterized protein n=1 Tax=Paramecium pentaurelia TaxID=43138 RepID=A0A8S1XWF9_9CILI|nr:unnamed protein product [Paramecium pentaurelia]